VPLRLIYVQDNNYSKHLWVTKLFWVLKCSE